MIKKKYRALSFFMGVIITGSVVFGSLTFADNVDDLTKKIEQFERDIENNKSSSEDIRANMSEIEEEIEEVEIKIEKIDNERQKISDVIESNTKEIARLDDEIERMNNEIASLEEELVTMRESYKKQVRFMYANGKNGFIEVLFSAKSLDAIMSYASFLNGLSKRTMEISGKINNNMAKIEENKEEIQENKISVEAKKQENLKKLAEQDEKRAEAQALADKLNDKRSDYQYTINKYNIDTANAKAEIERTKAAIERIKRLAEQQKNNGGNSGEYNATGEQIVALASEFLGDPYLWGGTKPWNGTYGTGFDCSGLVQYCYRQFGIETGRVTYQQIVHENGIRVEREDLQVGDLVFFGSWSDPHHVGLYMGDNKYIHAPKTGDVVKISKMTRKDFLIGRRFIK